MPLSVSCFEDESAHVAWSARIGVVHGLRRIFAAVLCGGARIPERGAAATTTGSASRLRGIRASVDVNSTCCFGGRRIGVHHNAGGAVATVAFVCATRRSRCCAARTGSHAAHLHRGPTARIAMGVLVPDRPVGLHLDIRLDLGARGSRARNGRRCSLRLSLYACLRMDLVRLALGLRAISLRRVGSSSVAAARACLGRSSARCSAHRRWPSPQVVRRS